MSRPAAIVTGARRGIGRAIALRLAATGFDVMATDLVRDAEADTLAEAVAEMGAGFAFQAGDVADLECHAAVVEAARAAFGRIDCLVNNAGIASPIRGDLLDLTPENFDTVLNVNLRGTVFLTQAVVKAMLAERTPRPRTVITVTSVSAELASPERADYCISKAGLSMWVKTLALRLAPEGIGVFEVRPGIIRTAMTEAVAGRYDSLIADGLVPARRWGEGKDVAAAVSALAGGAMAFSTGSVIHVDGALAVPRL